MRARFYNPQARARENGAASRNLLSPRLQVQELQAGGWRTRKVLRVDWVDAGHGGRDDSESLKDISDQLSAIRKLRKEKLEAYPDKPRDGRGGRAGSVNTPKSIPQGLKPTFLGFDLAGLKSRPPKEATIASGELAIGRKFFGNRFCGEDGVHVDLHGVFDAAGVATC